MWLDNDAHVDDEGNVYIRTKRKLVKMSKFTIGFMLSCAFFCGMAVERGMTLVAIICIICMAGAPYVMEEK